MLWILGVLRSKYEKGDFSYSPLPISKIEVLANCKKLHRFTNAVPATRFSLYSIPSWWTKRQNIASNKKSVKWKRFMQQLKDIYLKMGCQSSCCLQVLPEISWILWALPVQPGHPIKIIEFLRMLLLQIIIRMCLNCENMLTPWLDRSPNKKHFLRERLNP